MAVLVTSTKASESEVEGWIARYLSSKYDAVPDFSQSNGVPGDMANLWNALSYKHRDTMERAAHMERTGGY